MGFGRLGRDLGTYYGGRLLGVCDCRGVSWEALGVELGNCFFCFVLGPIRRRASDE